MSPKSSSTKAKPAEPGISMDAFADDLRRGAGWNGSSQVTIRVVSRAWAMLKKASDYEVHVYDEAARRTTPVLIHKRFKVKLRRAGLANKKERPAWEAAAAENFKRLDEGTLDWIVLSARLQCGYGVVIVRRSALDWIVDNVCANRERALFAADRGFCKELGIGHERLSGGGISVLVKARTCLSCGIVSKASMLKCGRCKVARYCCRECQKADWGAFHVRECCFWLEEETRDLADFESV